MYNIIEKLIEAKDAVEYEMSWRERLGQHVPAELKLIWGEICNLLDRLYDMK